MTVRELIKKLAEFNLDANMQVGDSDTSFPYTYAVGRIIYHGKDANPENADYVAIMPSGNDRTSFSEIVDAG